MNLVWWKGWAAWPDGWTADGVTAVSSAVMATATGVLVVAAIFALGQINEARQSRHSVTAIDFSRRWDDTDMIRTRVLVEPYQDPAAFKAVYFTLLDAGRAHATEDALQMLKEANYLEDLAILFRTGAVDEDFIVRSLGHILVDRWDNRWRDVANEYRVRNQRDNYAAWRDLVERIRPDPRLG